MNDIWIYIAIAAYVIWIYYAVVLIRNKKYQGRFTRKKLKERFSKILPLARLKLQRTFLVRSRFEDLVDKEVYEAFSFLRNIIIASGDRINGDYVLEQLSHGKGILQPAYVRMLSLFRENQKEAGVKEFLMVAETSMSIELAGILARWDHIGNSQLKDVLISYQKSIKEIWVTRQKQKDEIISDLIYLPVVVNVFVIFINFIYVGYFISQQEMLKMLL